MFHWFKSTVPAAEGMAKLTSEFGQMLDSGRHCFDVAANALLGGTDPEVIRKDLFSTDQRINAAEQQIRRHLVVHVSVHGISSLPSCLVLMSTVKDAERIGDYAKNVYDLTSQVEQLKKDPELREDLIDLKDRISEALATTREVYDSQDEQRARQLVRSMNTMEDRCDHQIEVILSKEDEHPCPATAVLAYRYFKRVISHAMNIATSTFMPLDKIDFFDEKPRPPKA